MTDRNPSCPYCGKTLAPMDGYPGRWFCFPTRTEANWPRIHGIASGARKKVFVIRKSSTIGRFRSPEAQQAYKDLMAARRPGETVLDAERRLSR